MRLLAVLESFLILTASVSAVSGISSVSVDKWSDALLSCRKAVTSLRIPPRRKASQVYSALLIYELSNFHANVKYVKYALQLLNFVQKGAKPSKRCTKRCSFRSPNHWSRTYGLFLISFIRNRVKLNRLNATGSSH